jgi:hypothetical protein
VDYIPIELQQKWAPVVGNLVIEFGHIESTITEVVRLSVLPAQFKILRNLNFSKKADFARAVLEDWNSTDGEFVRKAFAELNEISQRRNIVAHNGFSIAIYESVDDEGKYYEVGMSNSYKATDVWLQIGDLVKDTDALKLINEKLIGWVQKDKIKNLNIS